MVKDGVFSGSSTSTARKSAASAPRKGVGRIVVRAGGRELRFDSMSLWTQPDGGAEDPCPLRDYTAIIFKRKLMEECLFCRIVRPRFPPKIVHEDEQALVFKDVNPRLRRTC